MGKRLLAHLGKTFGKNNAGQMPAGAECVMTNMGELRGKDNARQCAAILKRVSADMGHGVRNAQY